MNQWRKDYSLKWMDQWIKNASKKQWTNESINKWLNHWIKKFMTESLNQKLTNE